MKLRRKRLGKSKALHNKAACTIKAVLMEHLCKRILVRSEIYLDVNTVRYVAVRKTKFQQCVFCVRTQIICDLCYRIRRKITLQDGKWKRISENDVNVMSKNPWKFFCVGLGVNLLILGCG